MEAKSDLSFVADNILIKMRETVHRRRIILYEANMERTDIDPELMKYARKSEASVQLTKALHDIPEAYKGVEVLVEWAGLTSMCNLI